MKFQASTKPIVDGLELGIISSNITKFYQKSCIVELTIEGDTLRVNTEVSAIKSELVFTGHVIPEDEWNHMFVDSMLLKNLIGTLDSETIEFEIKEDGLTVYSGKSKFNLPKVIDESDIELSRPERPDAVDATIDVDKSKWEFVSDHQMYAIAMSFIHPVYTRVWMGQDGDVIVGDFDNSIFTHSKMSQLPTTCLIRDTVVNLLNTVPDGSQIQQVGRNYEIKVELDPYSYLCEFMPDYETDEGIGDYNSDIILGLFEHNDSIKFNTVRFNKYLSQAELFTNSNDDTIVLQAEGDSLKLQNSHVNCSVKAENPFDDFKVTFKVKSLADCISHLDSEDVELCPMVQEEEIVGVVIWTPNMEIVVAGAE